MMPAINLGMPHHKGDDWRDKAECASIGGDLCFSDHWQDQVKAKDVCARCTVKESCLDEAVANDEHWGVWGQTSRNDRMRLRKQTA